MLNGKVVKNAGWIIACRVIQAILNLCVTVMTARYMGPSNYGLISYAASVVAFAVPVMQLGLNSVAVRFLVREPDADGEILGTSCVLSLSSAFLSIIGVSAFVAVINRGEPDTIAVCVLYSLLLVFQVFEIFSCWFQAKYISKYTALTMLAAYFAVSVYKVCLLISQMGVHWFAVAQAFDYLIIAVVLFLIYRKKGGGRLRFSKKRAREMLSAGKHYILSGMMITVFAQTDKIMLKLMVGEDATGYYSAAVLLAGMTGFVFAAIIDSARPAILETYDRSRADFEKSISVLYGVVIALSLLQCVFITVLAEPAVYITHGDQYADSIAPLRIIVWYTTFSYMGAVRDVWLLAEKKQKYLWIINISGAACNVALNFALIPPLGTAGAAAASLVTQIVTNFVLGFFMRPIRRNNFLMLRGILPATYKKSK